MQRGLFVSLFLSLRQSSCPPLDPLQVRFPKVYLFIATQTLVPRIQSHQVELKAVVMKKDEYKAASHLFS